ncbi:tRNA epoxyqueuosine(34) reductase QueG [Dysgonomonas sp. BGC7]|uniref:tRNA epoxyqueuosine(34) reductase QueG n=1 Tax=Dysgonomonas sp. BGC7 TaxID=1658008 RepID=UPI000A473933|nr:tRNA epoxyqueuosine(34) reductase QueG [Dysgonomonas sp. BGC7]MBD8389408.1 tRNA epoxyqueuosine(34) reductase QueG [Dysgonomonas sp. BGC7]
MTISEQIKEFAYSLGFDACGICRAEEVTGTEQQMFNNWIENSYNANMTYMAANQEKRLNPTLLTDGVKSVISVALNYYPEEKQPVSHPQFAYYAYGKDYHDVVKLKLQQLLALIQTIDPTVTGRPFVDTAPILERYWAVKAGLGFIGKNSMLIIPQKGSYFFLGELMVNKELDYDTPLNLSCGNCTRCIEACPTKAIVAPMVIDANKCISYQTIENKGSIASEIVPKMSNRFYGCDICQQICPWNRYARSHSTEEFKPSSAFMDLSFEKLDNLTVEEYQRIFKGSAVKRAKFSGLKRNLEALKSTKIQYE